MKDPGPIMSGFELKRSLYFLSAIAFTATAMSFGLVWFALDAHFSLSIGAIILVIGTLSGVVGSALFDEARKVGK